MTSYDKRRRLLLHARPLPVREQSYALRMLLLRPKPRPDRLRRQPVRIQQARVLPFHRGLKPQERAVVEWLLEHAVREGASPGGRLLAQLDAARVAGQCDCGCPTISIVVPGEALAPPSNRNLVATAIGIVEGSYVNLMLMQHQGHLSCLNVHNLDPIQRPYGLPDIRSLRPYWRL